MNGNETQLKTMKLVKRNKVKKIKQKLRKLVTILDIGLQNNKSLQLSKGSHAFAAVVTSHLRHQIYASVFVNRD